MIVLQTINTTIGGIGTIYLSPLAFGIQLWHLVESLCVILSSSYINRMIRSIRMKRIGNNRLEVRLSDEDLDALDQWRAKQPGVPNRAAAVRLMIERLTKPQKNNEE